MSERRTPKGLEAAALARSTVTLLYSVHCEGWLNVEPEVHNL